MTRVAVGSIMGAFGYMLVYAAVAERGKYALTPWKGLEV